MLQTSRGVSFHHRQGRQEAGHMTRVLPASAQLQDTNRDCVPATIETNLKNAALAGMLER